MMQKPCQTLVNFRGPKGNTLLYSETEEWNEGSVLQEERPAHFGMHL